jgi:REP-associated tyrosine transposase
MPDYRRYFVPGGTFFFTVVTAKRHHLFANAWARRFLGQVMRATRDESPFETVAMCYCRIISTRFGLCPATTIAIPRAGKRSRRDSPRSGLNSAANPVKHEFARCPKDWPWSSFHRFVESGHYPPDWGCADRAPPDLGNVDAELLE